MTTPAGWYDDGSGRQRWWDGLQWTEHFADQQPPMGPGGGAQSASSTATGAATNLQTTNDMSAMPGTIWSAVGKPLTGIGAGRYRLTEDYLIFERGTLSTKSQQIRVSEIFDVDASQTMTQKARGVGSIRAWARRPSGDEQVLIDDIPNFREGVEQINRTADEARHRTVTRQNTQHVNYSGTPAIAQAPVGAGSAQALDLNSEIARLAEFHKQGILSDEEFAAGKRRLLGL